MQWKISQISKVSEFSIHPEGPIKLCPQATVNMPKIEDLGITYPRDYCGVFIQGGPLDNNYLDH